MKRKFAFLNLFLGCFSLFTIHTKFTPHLVAEDLIKIDLDLEIKKGYFLIGLKPYLGGDYDSFSKNQEITFVTDKGFLNLYSSNGIEYKAKNITIQWSDIPTKSPKTIKELFLVLLQVLNQHKNKQRY